MKRTLRALAFMLIAAACGGQPGDEAPPDNWSESGPAAAAPSVTILAPAEASFQEEKDVTVWLRSHMGDALTEYVFENVSSGPHRLIAVLADGAHIPLPPLVVDTVEFVVE